MLGRKIKECRTSAKLTQLELGKMLGVGKSNISMYESGARIPPLDIIRQMAEIFKVDLNYLGGYSDKIQPTEEITLDDGEKAWLDLYRSMTEEERALFLRRFRAEI